MFVVFCVLKPNAKYPLAKIEIMKIIEGNLRKAQEI